MTKLRQKLIDDLMLAGYTASTVKDYVGKICRLAKFYNRPPDTLSTEEIRHFVLHLIKEKKLSPSYIRQTVRGIELFYTLTLKRDWKDLGILRPRGKKKLPVVLSKQEVNAILKETRNLKHRTIFTVIYSGGLRIREVVNLKVTDIESDRKLIKVNHGKGGLQRYTILGEKTLALLRVYWKVYTPHDWLFPSGQNPVHHLSTRTIQKELKKAAAQAKIKKRVVAHTLRHSFATHLLEAGVNLRIIQELLGHKDVSSTAIYTHVSKETIEKVRCPIDEK